MTSPNDNARAEAGPPVDAIAYEQVSRALEQQAGVLDELRQRTATLIAAASLLAAFLGGTALKLPADGRGPGVLLVLALLAFLLGVGASLYVLLPTRVRKRNRSSEVPTKISSDDGLDALVFSLNVETLIDHADERGIPMPDTARMHAARSLQLGWDGNRSIIADKQSAFALAALSLFAQAITWIVYIAIGKGVI